MRNIQIQVINPQAITDTENIAIMAARLTQHGHKVTSIEDVMQLMNTKDVSVKNNIIKSLASLPHKNLFRHNMISVIVYGASRRFLAQITRHQEGVTFTSASCQYSDYTGVADFVVPFNVDKIHGRIQYIENCKTAMREYERYAQYVGHDDAAYLLPQALRNVLIISATPAEWQHIIQQRSCRRNTEEMRYVILKIWSELYKLSPFIFAPSVCGSFCQIDYCKEGRFCCGNNIDATLTPDELLKEYKS